ncbi:hypothetical protein SKC41_29755 [Mycobacterium sp. 050128]|uniref:hypothetical protein n=1 Tax=Mycobacterium sp. 050128 TaxID=3096112 RepID=UPI002EDA9233
MTTIRSRAPGRGVETAKSDAYQADKKLTAGVLARLELASTALSKLREEIAANDDREVK